MTLRCKFALVIVAACAVCVGCQKEDLGTSVPHKPHDLTGAKKGGGADMDLIPAPAGMKTGTPK
jgi:hypothetical protein